MARSKSISRAKASRSNLNGGKDQIGLSNPVNAVPAETAPAEVKAEIEGAPEPGKFEVVKTEPRKNVVVPISLVPINPGPINPGPINPGPINPGPINLVPINLENEIRRRAYELYLQRGPASGSEAEDWLIAEREVKQRYQQQSA